MNPQLNALPLLTDSDIATMKGSGLKEWWKPWMDAQLARFGTHLSVTPIPKGIHEYKDPIAEAVEIIGADRVIGIKGVL